MLEISGLTRRFGPQTVLNDVSLTIAPGQVACIVGPSGCGKSTLLRLVAGLDRPDLGTIAVNGTTLSSPGWALEPHKRQLNMVFQDYALWPHMSVEKIVGYGLDRLDTESRKTRVLALLDQLRISALADRLPSQISGGQQQRVAIARALATDPALLLLDEPLSNLDVQLRLEMRKEFSTLFRSVGKTVLYVTHDPLEAASFADVLVVMNKGEIEQVGTPEALFASPRSAWIATLAGYDTSIEGTLIAHSDERAITMQVGAQPLHIAHTGNSKLATAPSGTELTLMLASDRVDVTQGGGDPARNSLQGRVTHCLFEGRNWRLVVDVAGNAISAVTTHRASVGSHVNLSFSPDSALIFAK
ncbi:iron(III) transport system ATP-binding protein/putative spermidine/putrescine transport system ATP-binding protein [Devosia crocina]|uniref:Iron(III) transport system ATP-binding protein/putative spermidine/putrescine transport system ATP-binding protein n=1 Tax=Devosia crocina TaxID=429728 RepID=A0A1I7NVA3_9HYPH|nr:ABC transporter ATP-binding protein [Devosia crocina]SFV38523.1 iron(III) transport system ATP-binding protein/putative spermidine/putrescine transport system ATP-binding protein [Devosia crocina]